LLNQTFTDVEILVIDDGGSDGSMEIVRDSGISGLRILEGPNAGLAAALALGVRESRTQLIFRQDQDDVSMPTRFETQLHFMEENADCVALGSAAVLIDELGRRVGLLRQPLTHEAIALRMCVMSPMVHPSVVLRRDAVLAAGNYWSPSAAPFAEDFHLWSRLVCVGEFHNLAEPLLEYRLSPGGVSRQSWLAIATSAGEVAADCMAGYLGSDTLTDCERDLVALFHRRTRRLSIREARILESLLIRARVRAGTRHVRGGFPWDYYLRPVGWTVRRPRGE
jgi:glycosyltransferase involved in cell wall biosynthesis